MAVDHKIPRKTVLTLAGFGCWNGYIIEVVSSNKSIELLQKN